MALFGLSDITFNKGGQQSRKGPLGQLVGSAFETTTLRYPLDIGNYDKGHYMVFYIREQKNTSYPSRATNAEISGATGGLTKIDLQDPMKAASSFGNEIVNKISSGLNQINQETSGVLGNITSKISNALPGVAKNINSGINNIFGQGASVLSGSSAKSQATIDDSIKSITGGSLGFLRTTKLTKDAIALYMPDTLMFNYSQSYDQLNLGEDILGQAMAAGSGVLDKIKAKDYSGALKEASGAAALNIASNAAKKLGGAAGEAGLAAALGVVKNPMLEMIYRSPNFRTFQFDFMFYPRDEREALEVQRIVERFRFHQAPELAAPGLKTGGAGFLVPPSEFDIKFYYGGRQNPNIPQVATCILTTIDLNYAPNGWSAYEIPGENNPALGRTGMPVAMQMTLQFQEVTYLTKKDFTSDSELDTKNALSDFNQIIQGNGLF